MTTVSTVTLLWLTTVYLTLRRSSILSCAVVGSIMPRFACCLWPTITHCMNVRFGSEALQLLFCSFCRSGNINTSASSSDSVSSLWIRFDCTCSELVPNMRVFSMCSLVSVYLHSRDKMRTVFIYASTLFPIVLFHRSQYESSNSNFAFGATYFRNQSQYTNMFDSVSYKYQVLETPMPSSPDHRSKYFTLKGQCIEIK